MTAVNVYATVYSMWSTEEIEAMEADEAYCDHCQERDLTAALVPVYVKTREWHRTERMVHPECRPMFVKANLEDVLASLRLLGGV